MKFAACAGVVAAIVNVLFADDATLVVNAQLRLKNGSVELSKGTTVEVLSTRDETTRVRLRGLEGTLPTAALESPQMTAASTPPPSTPSLVQKASEDTNFKVEVASAAATLEEPSRAAGEVLLKGDIDAANQILFDTFPERTRSPAQKFALGNLLFRQEPKLTYALHREVAAALSTLPEVQFEWALQQHRAKEYAGALKTYEIVHRAWPEFAPALGLAAECAIRTGPLKKRTTFGSVQNAQKRDLWKASRAWFAR